MKLSEKIKKFPAKPGVYLFKSIKGEVLYVGKAKSLRSRAGSYFKKPKEAGTKTEFLLKRAADIDFIVTDNEKEAFLLENTLIKRHRPRYNIQLKDDKTYVSIRLGLEHRYPGISILRRVLKDGAAYFGPFVSSVAARETVEQVVRSFRVRTCSDREFANRVRPCLEFDLGRCSAPCVGKISKEEYCECINDTAMFLKGSGKELLSRLKEKMRTASSGLKYEDAGRIRDAISMIEETLSKQKVVVHGGGDRDVIGLARDGDRISLCILMVRGGILLDRRMHAMAGVEENEGEMVRSFLLEHYVAGGEIPAQIQIPCRIEGQAALESILKERRGGNVRITIPKRGAHLDMIELAKKNAHETLRSRAAEKKDWDEILARIRRKLRMGRLPEAIECLDISNLMGREAYGSLVTFMRGEPDRLRYRLYSIRTLQTPDDYGMMREVLSRRFRPESTRPEPDLLLIDGGKGQLNVAIKVLAEFGLEDLSVAAIAKGGDASGDRVFLPGRKNPVTFKRGAPEMLLLQRIRDEAHRFGITAHRKRRVREIIKKR